MRLDSLYAPLEGADTWLTSLFEGAPLLVALAVAALLGLRHASDPDHLVAVTSLMAAEDGDSRAAARLGAWWGAGHATVLLLVGLPLIAFKAGIPGWLEAGAETGVGLVILVLAARVVVKWARGDYHATSHRHAGPDTDSAHDPSRRHLRRGEGSRHRHGHVRGAREAFSIGALHGLAGTGAVTLLLVAALPSQVEAGLALAVFAPVSIASMIAWTTAFAWICTRRLVEPLYTRVLIPVLGLSGLVFGLSFAGIA